MTVHTHDDTLRAIEYQKLKDKVQNVHVQYMRVYKYSTCACVSNESRKMKERCVYRTALIHYCCVYNTSYVHVCLC